MKLRQEWDDGSSTTQSCDVFTGAEGVEGLLYVKDRFDNVIENLQMTDGQQLFYNFERILADTALDKWMNLTSGIVAADRTEARFNQAFAEYL